ncbi:MAG: hypothetical protein K2W96_06640 [Gemmataceae bacterium]|nr:hypothetical protein [Gemmataceae bacterium]
MNDSRRLFLAGVAGTTLALRAGAVPTAASGTLREYRSFLKAVEAPKPGLPGVAAVVKPPRARLALTADNILGPYYRAGAPFRAKITPPLEPGDVLVVRGRVWSADTSKPLPDARLDIWQADAKGRYDNDDADNPPKAGVYLHRARLATDETGYYEYETVKPGHYKIGPDAWRPAHIHYAVWAPGHKLLVTQLYFKGDKHNAKDDFIKPSLVIDPAREKSAGGAYLLGTFDVVLAKAPR